MPLEDEIYKSKKSETYVFFIYHCFFITPELKYKNLELIALERLKQNDKINPLTSMSKITNLKTLNLASEGLVKIKIKGTFLKDAYVLVVGSLRFIDSAVVKELINRGVEIIICADKRLSK